jgi:hypothetical protein
MRRIVATEKKKPLPNQAMIQSFLARIGVIMSERYAQAEAQNAEIASLQKNTAELKLLEERKALLLRNVKSERKKLRLRRQRHAKLQLLRRVKPNTAKHIGTPKPHQNRNQSPCLLGHPLQQDAMQPETQPLLIKAPKQMRRQQPSSVKGTSTQHAMSARMERAKGTVVEAIPDRTAVLELEKGAKGTIMLTNKPG